MGAACGGALGAGWACVLWTATASAQGFHRLRKEKYQNPDVNNVAVVARGREYLALKIAPSWVFAQGFEYTSLVGQPTYYFNGSVLYKFASGSNVRASVGQQRGAFSGARPACAGTSRRSSARVELTLRFWVQRAPRVNLCSETAAAP
jgi:hypothetical protein